MTTIFFGVVMAIIAIALVIIALTLVAIYGLLTNAQRQFTIATGALSIIATTLDERAESDPEERLFFRNLSQAIWQGITEGAAYLRNN